MEASGQWNRGNNLAGSWLTLSGVAVAIHLDANEHLVSGAAEDVIKQKAT
jgi:hypothetical protein